MAEVKKRLVRAREGAWIGGVCAGIGRHAGVPVWAVRTGYVLLSIFPLFPGILVYIILWVVIPREPAPLTGLQPSATAASAQPKEAHG